MRGHDAKGARLALIWRGEPGQTTNHPERLAPLCDALAALGVATEPILWREAAAEAVSEALLARDGVMVWVNPLADGRDRSVLDPLLSRAAEHGVWVSAHPQTILAMGVKEVLVRTRALGWSADVRMYDSAEAFQAEFPAWLRPGEPRVLKPSRGNDGQGVWRVERLTAARVRAQAAASDTAEELPIDAFVERCAPWFARGGRIIDQAFQPRVGEGMVRCYMSEDRVVGFSEQRPRAPGPWAFAMASAKTMRPADYPRFAGLRRRMEEAWTPAMQALLGIETARLPAIWDADFLLGPRTADGDSFVLCEINVSSVLPFPPVAAPAIARTVAARLAEARGRR